MLRIVLKLFGVIAVLSLAVALIAEAALPGDILYRFKVEVNEPVKSWLVNDQSQAAFEIGLLNERLAEIDQLVETGKLDAKAAGVAKQQVANQLQSATAAVTATAGANMSPVERAAFVAALEDIKQSLLVHQASLNELIAAGDTATAGAVDTAASIDLGGVTESFSDMLDQLTDVATDVNESEVGVVDESIVDVDATSTATTTDEVLAPTADEEDATTATTTDATTE